MRFVTVLLTLVASLVWITDADAQRLVGPRPLTGGPLPEPIPGQYIVELHPGASADALLRAHGIAAIERWQIINGFVAHLPDAARARLSVDPTVRSVRPDLVVRASIKFGVSASAKPGGGGGGTAAPTCPDTSAATDPPQVTPMGVQRIGAASGGSTGAGIKVAVIDTGIDDCHPDLNVVGGKNFIARRGTPRDDNGHGTHVAGIIGGRNNGFGVVGVAPDVSLYSLKVLGADGSGALSSVVSALDFAVRNGIRVANLSLGAVDAWCVLFGLCGGGSECSAITNATARGVTVVVAAGNSAAEAVFYTPANCQDSVTVTAFVDSDGAAGGAGFAYLIGDQLENDDTFAQSFSNFSVFGWDMDGSGAVDSIADHPVVDLTAPGVNIKSTTPTYPVSLSGAPYNLTPNYGYLTGTSMATPHVAGAAARYLQENPGATADQVRRALVSAGECPTGESPTWLVCPTKWPDDPDEESGSEPLVRVPF